MTQILNSLVSAEPDVNSWDIHDNNAILLAVERGCVHEVKALRSAGADVNTKSLVRVFYIVLFDVVQWKVLRNY